MANARTTGTPHAAGSRSSVRPSPSMAGDRGMVLYNPIAAEDLDKVRSLITEAEPQ